MIPLKKTLTLAGAALAASAVAFTTLAPASAMSQDNLVSRLQKQGYTVTVDSAPVPHGSLDINGRMLTVSKGPQAAKVEVLDYGTTQKLQLDWSAVNGSGPVARDATTDFNGRVPMWNLETVILADYRVPNDAAIAKDIVDTFLDRAPGDAPAPTPKPPSTGNGITTSAGGDSSPVSPALGALAAASAATLGGLALSLRRQRRDRA